MKHNTTVFTTVFRVQIRPGVGDHRAARHAAGPGARRKTARRNGRGSAGGRRRAGARVTLDRRSRGSSAAPSAATSPGGANRPDCSGSITSACAPTGVATTASPCASPSSTDIASPSACEGSTRISADRAQGAGRRLIDPAREGHPVSEPKGGGADPEFVHRPAAGERRTPWQRGQRRARQRLQQFRHALAGAEIAEEHEVRRVRRRHGAAARGAGCGSGTAFGRTRMGASGSASAARRVRSASVPRTMICSAAANMPRTRRRISLAPRTDIHGVIVVVDVQDIRQRDRAGDGREHQLARGAAAAGDVHVQQAGSAGDPRPRDSECRSHKVERGQGNAPARAAEEPWPTRIDDAIGRRLRPPAAERPGNSPSAARCRRRAPGRRDKARELVSF